MTIFDVLSLIGGLCLFLFGMNIMGDALERRAGGKLRTLLGKLTTNRAAGLLTGMGVTSVIQSSSATTVMVVGFVNSGLMTLSQAINVIMGSNIGTTITAWILSLGGIESDNVFVKLLKPSSFTPVLALIGIIFCMFFKDGKKKDTGTILLGFATLMFGMEAMSDAVSVLKNVPAFTNLFVAFQNPILGVLAGAVLTAIIQSSSASVGILQSLSATGAVTYGAAIPIIMGQNIGTCITAILSSIGANKNAKRAAAVHLSFNVIGAVACLTIFSIIKAVFSPAILGNSIDHAGIAIVHSLFNILCTLLLLPAARLLEKLVIILIPDSKRAEKVEELDERLLATPPFALQRAREVTADLAKTSIKALKGGLSTLFEYRDDIAEIVHEEEDISDHYEDIIGSYLVKLSSRQISESDSAEVTKLLKIIGDFERISDHGVSLVKSAEEMREKKIAFSAEATAELRVLAAAITEILDLTYKAFIDGDLETAEKIEPLEQVIDRIKEKLRTRHILRLQQGECSIDAGFILSDLLTNLARTSDHCSNIAGCIIELQHNDMNLHETLRELKTDNEDFKANYAAYKEKYSLKKI
ncbi:MAG: Na/Pi cotransporter family protein [Oscillospiraceae bacterium]|nr:Na/Pi cotransporter family protein [Oscillospiraceae bacterium]